MKIFKLSMRFYICQITLAIISVTFILPLYNLALNRPYIYSLITSGIYFMTMYSAAWRAGRADSRKLPGFYPDKKLPLWISLITLIIPLVLFAIRFALPDIWRLNLPFLDGSHDFFVSGCRVYGTPDMIFRTWYFPFAAFIKNSSPISYLLTMLVLPAIIFIGYNVGLTRFSVTDYLYSRLVYKRKQKK